MVTRIGGSRRKSRKKFKKPYRKKGKTPLRHHLQTFEEGDRVVLKADPSEQHGMYHARYHGRTGTIIGQQGSCYRVRVMDGNAEKIFILKPVHLKEVSE